MGSQLSTDIKNYKKLKRGFENETFQKIHQYVVNFYKSMKNNRKIFSCKQKCF